MTSSPPSSAELLRADARVIAGIAKLRFGPHAYASGHGCWLFEPGGRRVLDLSATWTASGLGHAHPEVAAAISRAATTAPGAGALSLVHPGLVGLAEDLLSLVPGAGERRVHFGHSGSDANDVALRATRHATGRSRIISFERSYHGGLGVALGVSGLQVAGGATPDPGCTFVPFPDPFRSAPESDPLSRSLDAVARELAAGDVACVIVEPIQSDGGVVVPPPGFLAALAALCRQHEALLLCDEVKVGLGRTGLLHAFAHDGVVPDLVTLGKSLGAGLPLSAVIGPAEILDRPRASALLTTAGNPVCTSAGRTMLRLLEELDLAANATARGDQLRALIGELAHGDTPAARVVGDVRGRGLSIGVDLVVERSSRVPDPLLARKVAFRAWELGALLYVVGDSVLEITPPLIIDQHETERAGQIVIQAITDAADGRVSDEAVAAYGGW
jgi:4-aminobutyrate aminotransferase